MILALAVHNHQPVGNFPQVFEAAYTQSYLPMLQALDRHPRVRLAMHYSGPLLDWLEASHPEFFPRLRALVDRGQIEMMTGGYYEPILAIIPERDRAGQIRKMTSYLERRFGVHPQGLWLAERIWEPQLAGSIAASGVTYTIVDDAHFLAAGLGEEDLTGYFVTEDQGVTLKVFPSLRALRYLIPWRPVSEVLAFLRERAAHVPFLLMGDDGEKFGLWPGTYAHCWGSPEEAAGGWMEQFFAALEAESAWLEVGPPGDVTGQPAAGRAYLPTASYDEMEEWALPAATGAQYAEIRRRMEDQGDPALRFLRGGFWRQFLAKYPEINTMHKKMLRVSEKVWRLPAGRRRRQALDEVWQGQCNCPYWHGVFGGVYLPHIRQANFAHLIAAEALADERRSAPLTAVSADLDGDGAAEVELSSPAMVLWIDPDGGGGVVAWDWRAAGINLVNVLTRREEAYHRLLRHLRPAEAPAEDAVETIHTERIRTKEPGLDRLLVYDRYRKASFLEHLLPTGFTREALASGEAPSVATFTAARYEAAISRPGGGAEATLTREAVMPGGVAPGGPETVLRVEKRIRIDDQAAQLRAVYVLTNRGDHALHGLFGVETNWAITDPQSPLAVGGVAEPAHMPRSVETAGRVEVVDYGWPGPVRLTFPAAAVWHVPLWTVSNSEAGFERTFQGTTVLFTWPLSLEPGQVWESTIDCALDATR